MDWLKSKAPTAGTEAQGRGEQKVRPAAVAGMFYPANPQQLSKEIGHMLAVANASVDGTIVAAVAPHAGYIYSGQVAAYAYSALRRREFQRVVVLSPTHCVSFRSSSVYDGDCYRTPLGDVPVGREFARRLAAMSPTIELGGNGHDVTRAGAEHAIEVQLPWLLTVLGNFELVPVVMGDQSYEASRALGVAVAELVESEAKPTLVLASSDLSHYHSSADAKKMDLKTLEAIGEWDYLSLSRNLRAQVWEACGGAAIVAAMIYAERMGANRAEILRYANSGDVTGDHARVVGYGAAVLVRSKEGEDTEVGFSLSEGEKAELLALARGAVEQTVSMKVRYEPVAPESAALNREAGAFVTLTRHGELRGCVGYTSAAKPLYETVRDAAVMAATRDTRFLPVGREELSTIRYEISVLSPLRRVMKVDEIVVGRDGLLVKNGGREGLLLPQVATEYGWDRGLFLEQTCVKAGLSRDAWKDEETDIFRFHAIVFHEE